MTSAVQNYPALALIEGRLTVSVEEVVAILGVGRSTVAYDAVRTGRLPSHRLGPRIVISVPLLLAWLGVSPDRPSFRPGGNQCRRVR